MEVKGAYTDSYGWISFFVGKKFLQVYKTQLISSTLLYNGATYPDISPEDAVKYINKYFGSLENFLQAVEDNA